MLVYRFENREESGPWASGATEMYDTEQRTRNRYHSCGDMPGPCDLAEMETHLFDHCYEKGREGYKFAFLNLKQLKSAFRSPRGRQAMALMDIHLFVYEVDEDDVIQGTAQCLFPRGKGTIVGELDLKTLKPICNPEIEKEGHAVAA